MSAKDQFQLRKNLYHSSLTTNVLTEKGIPQSDIVLKYQAPKLRQYIPYAKVMRVILMAVTLYNLMHLKQSNT